MTEWARTPVAYFTCPKCLKKETIYSSADVNTHKCEPFKEVEIAFEKTAFMELEIETIYYVIYEKPLDYPTEYVVRKWLIDHSGSDPIPNGLVGRAPTLELARHFIPPNLFRLSREERDEPQIVETWI